MAPEPPHVDLASPHGGGKRVPADHESHTAIHSLRPLLALLVNRHTRHTYTDNAAEEYYTRAGALRNRGNIGVKSI